MKKYRDFAPTGFDHKGLGLPKRQEWLVSPAYQDRDSGIKAKSNFGAVLKALDRADISKKFLKVEPRLCEDEDVLRCHTKEYLATAKADVAAGAP